MIYMKSFLAVSRTWQRWRSIVSRLAASIPFSACKSSALCLIQMRYLGSYIRCSSPVGKWLSTSTLKAKTQYREWCKVSSISFRICQLSTLQRRAVANTSHLDVYNTVWPFFLGNCHLTRNTHKSVIQAGDWDKVELTLPTSEDAWLVFPRISGRVVKKL